MTSITIDPSGGMAAWTDALAQVVGGGIIELVANATYAITEPIVIPSKVWMRGNQALLQISGNQTKPMINAWGYTRLEDFTMVDLTGKATALSMMSGATWFSASHLDIENFRVGISLTNCWCGAWRDVTVRANGGLAGIQVTGKFVNAMVWSAMGVSGFKRGIDVAGDSHQQWKVQGTFENNRECAIYIGGGAQMWNITDCYFEQNQTADVIVDGYGAEANRIENCLSVPGPQTSPYCTRLGVWVKKGIRTHIGHNCWFEPTAWQIDAAAYGTEIVSQKPINHTGTPVVKNYSKSTTIFEKSVRIDTAPVT